MPVSDVILQNRDLQSTQSQDRGMQRPLNSLSQLELASPHRFDSPSLLRNSESNCPHMSRSVPEQYLLLNQAPLPEV